MKWKRIWISLWLLTLLAIFIVTLINRTPYFLLGGSSSVAPVMQELITEYPDNHKNGDFNYVSSASAGAPPRVENKIFGIGWLSEEYKVDTTKTPDLIDFQMMRDGLIIVYNIPTENLIDPNKTLDFNTEKVQELYLENKSWQEVFPEEIKGEITVKAFTRPNGSGTRSVFDHKVLNDQQYYKANTVDSSGAMLNLDVGSIGYTSFADYAQAGQLVVKKGTWEGIEANYQNISDQSYTLWRPFTGLINKNFKYKTDIIDLLLWIFDNNNETVTNIFAKFGPRVSLDEEVNQELNAWLTQNKKI